MSHIITKLVAATALFGLVGCADAETGDVVGPRGGMVISDDGRLTLVVPMGALSDDVNIRVVVTDDEPSDAVGPTYTLLPMGTAFSVPATINYDLDELSMDGLDKDTLSLVVEKDHTWFYLADQVADEDMISASTVYLSSFTVVADQDEDHDHDHDEDDN